MRTFLRSTIAAVAVTGAVATVPASTGAATAPAGSRQVIVLMKGVATTGLRSANLRIAESALTGAIARSGGSVAQIMTAPSALVVNATSSTIAALEGNPLVAGIYANGIIHGPTVAHPSITVHHAAAKTGHVAPGLCGTSSDPQLNPEALSAINAPAAWATSIGAGVNVGFMADGIDTSNPDLQRNPSFAASSGDAFAPVITSAVDFSGDGTNATTGGGEAFLDASSIAAQGNSTYDISNQGSSVNPLPAGCDIKIEGAAPGATVTALKVFGQTNLSTNVGFVEAINYAVTHGVKVLNESFGSNPMPSTTADLIRAADDAAVAAGVTVVVSTGDAGYNSTIGSPADDPKVIAVGATTTLRGYAQTTYGGINAPGSNGQWINNQISSISSGGVAEDGRTVDLVAPGDLNWALCSASSNYSDCGGASVELSGGTSESSPLVAGAAADVIAAYAKAHNGTYPTPAVVKAILTGTATDLGAPATGQGSGLLNVAKAVNVASHYATKLKTAGGGVTASTSGVIISAAPGKSVSQSVTFTNSTAKAAKLTLSGRELVSSGVVDGTVTLDPSSTTTQPTFPIWSGVNEIYQTVPITVAKGTAYLRFITSYPYSGQTSLLHVALFDPSGAYAGYSDTQGLANSTSNEVANPAKGTWTAVLFTYANAGGSGTGTSGVVRYEADSFTTAKVAIGKSSVNVPANGSTTATLKFVMPSSSGDTSLAVVVSTPGQKFTIPVTERVTVPVVQGLGTFTGTVAGGNGRGGAPAQTSTYTFAVPAGEKNLQVSMELDQNRPAGVLIGSQFVATLIDPTGQVIAEDTNLSIDTSQNENVAPWLSLFANAPVPGTYQVVIQVANPVGGGNTSTTLNGQVTFNSVVVTGSLPSSAATTVSATSGTTATISVTNNGYAPLIIGADPRLTTTTTATLSDVNGAPSTQAFNNYWTYFVPPSTQSVTEQMTSTLPASFEFTADLGDPSLSPLVPTIGQTSTQNSTDASLTWAPSTGVATGLYGVVPQPTGVFTTTPVGSGTATSTFTATTKALDPAITTDAGNFVSSTYGLNTVDKVGTVVNPGDTATITVTIAPTAAVGSVVHGTLGIESISVGGALEYAFGMSNAGYIVQSDPQISILGSVPYTYTVGS